MTVLVREPGAFRQACEQARREGRQVGLVPTMGALHAGHFALMEEAKRRCNFVVATVFVNPLQFAPDEDLSRYPRTLDEDVAGCRDRSVDLVYAPSAEAMYAQGFQTHVEVRDLTLTLEGVYRPDHFRGVTTVVAKLFNLTGPCVAVFGRKDYQQWRVVARMVQDLDLPVEVVGHAIVRERDGLALSSRNRYLSPADRQRALGLVEGLRRAHDAWLAGARHPHQLCEVAQSPVDASFDAVDYVAAVDPETLRTPPPRSPRVLIVMAAHLGTTRLIDNIVLGEESRP